MGSTASTSKKGMTEAVPMWIYTAKLPEDQSNHKFAAMSSGMQQLGPNTVARQRTGKFDTDAARWKEGFSSGKHVFEVVFPVAQRGIHASVGVGHDNVPLTINKSVSLVGNCKESWALDLSTRRAMHAAGMTKYPSTQVFMPDKFYMYLDADSGSLSFGSDHTFYGTAFNGIPTTAPLYPMVSSPVHGATITLFYRGEGDISRVVNMTMTPAGPPLVQPIPREEPPPYTAGPATYHVPLERGATTMSKMTEACGPPPPPPTKMSNNPHGQDVNTGSQTSLRKDDYMPIPEENKEGEEEKNKESKKGKKNPIGSAVSETGESAVGAEPEEAKVEPTAEAEVAKETVASEQTGEKDSAGND